MGEEEDLEGEHGKGGKSYPFGNFILSNYNVGSQPRRGGGLNNQTYKFRFFVSTKSINLHQELKCWVECSIIVSHL